MGRCKILGTKVCVHVHKGKGKGKAGRQAVANKKWE